MKTMRHPFVRTTALAAAMLLAGCAVGPDFHTTPDYHPAAYLPVAGATPATFVAGETPSPTWWTLYGSSELDALIDRALANHPSIESAQAALTNAQEVLAAQRSTFFPTVNANLNPTRQKTARSLSSVPSTGKYIYNLHTAQLSIGYSPDLFGGNRRQVESLVAQSDVARFELQAARITLVTNLCSAVAQAAALREQRAITGQLISEQRQALDILHKRKSAGDAADADVLLQATALAQTQATLPPIDKALGQQEDAIAVMTGVFPDAQPLPLPALDRLAVPDRFPVSMPARLLEQRPDVRVAEAQWHAANAQIGVAEAARLPNVQIAATLGSAAARTSRLFSAATGFWSLAGNVAAPVFDGGALAHKQRAAEATAHQAAADYRGTVLSAFGDVADALRALQADSDTVTASRQARTSCASSYTAATKQLAAGDISVQAMLQTQATCQQLDLAFVQAQGAKLADVAALYQSLGAGPDR